MQSAQTAPTGHQRPRVDAPPLLASVAAVLDAPAYIPPPAYTHQDHAAACGSAGRQGITLNARHVQARIFGVTHCARLLEAWTTSEGRDMWSVLALSPTTGRISVRVSRVVACSGLDGRCVCAGELGLPEVPF
jgi:hypothetical protein